MFVSPQIPRLLGAALLLVALAWPAVAQESASARFDADLSALEQSLAEAHFRSVLGIARQFRKLPGATPAQTLRLELAAATAAVALGDDAAAREGFGRVLQVEPGFAFDDEASPKLRRALAAARGEG